MFGSADNLTVPRPRLGILNFTSDRSFYFLTLAITLVVCVVVIGVRRGRLGRMLEALSESPELLQANGASANITKLMVFCLSACLAGIGGGLLGAVTQTTGGLSFDFSVSLIMVAVLFVAGRQPILSAFIAAGLYQVAVPYIKSQSVQNYSGVVFGVAALIVATRIVPTLIGRMKAARRASQRLEASRVDRLGIESAQVRVA
jgi:ABC-type branched-subunit amino acid transport system permease subunit